MGRGRAALQGRPARPLFINISNNGIEIVPPPREKAPKKANEVLTDGPAAEPLAAKEKSDWPGASQGAGNRLRQSGARGQMEHGLALAIGSTTRGTVLTRSRRNPQRPIKCGLPFPSSALVVMAADSMLRRANRAQAGSRRLHDQADYRGFGESETFEA